jgi:hypothetical protein
LLVIRGFEAGKRSVRAAADQAVVIQQMAKLGGRMSVTARQFNALKSDLFHARERARKVRRALPANRKQLQANGNTPGFVRGTGQRRRGESKQNFAAGNHRFIGSMRDTSEL